VRPCLLCGWLTASGIAAAGLVMVACAPVAQPQALITGPVPAAAWGTGVDPAPMNIQNEAGNPLNGKAAIGSQIGAWPAAGVKATPKSEPQDCPAIPREVRAEAERPAAAVAEGATAASEARKAAALRRLVALYDQCQRTR
jgi:hypothetical protein